MSFINQIIKYRARIIFNLSFVASVLATIVGSRKFGVSYGMAMGLGTFVVCLIATFFLGYAVGLAIKKLTSEHAPYKGES